MAAFKTVIHWPSGHTTFPTVKQPTPEAASEATARFLRSIGADPKTPFQIEPDTTDYQVVCDYMRGFMGCRNSFD